MESKTWLDYLTAIGAAATPVIVLVLTGVGWQIRQRLERRNALEERLREDRTSTYNQILEPFIVMFMSDEMWKADSANKNRDKNLVATQKMLSLQYRQAGFSLALVGSDDVVKAYNDLMQYFFQRSEVSPQLVDESRVRDMLSLVGKLLLAIRKSFGNDATKLDNWAMLEWFVSDARRLRDAA